MFFFFKQKTAYEMRISDWSSDVCSSDLFYQLLHQEAFDPRLPQAIIGLASAGLVDARLGEAHDLLTRLLVCCRFLAHGLKEPEDVPPNVAALIARACGFGSWDETLAAYDEARQCVTEHWSLIAKGKAA